MFVPGQKVILVHLHPAMPWHKMKIGQVFTVQDSYDDGFSQFIRLKEHPLSFWFQSDFEEVKELKLSVTETEDWLAPKKPIDDYVCKRCGNAKCCTRTEKTCWSCGETIKP